MNKTFTPNCAHAPQSTNLKRFSLSKIASGILLLAALLVTSSKSASAGTVTFPSDNGAYSIVVTMTAPSLNKSAPAGNTFNYTINLNYTISFTGTVPSGFQSYTRSVSITNNDPGVGTAQIPPFNTPGASGTLITNTQTHTPASDFATATPASIGANTASITLAALGLTSTTKTVDLSAAPLPVQVKAFTAKQSSEGVAVAWETAQETQVKSFTIERSNNGTEWKNITTVAAKGTHTSGANYAITDKVALEGNAYYRLSELGVNGATIYYNTVVVNRNARVSTTPQIFPNPNAGNTIYFSGLENGDQWALSVTGAGAQNVNMLAVANGQVTLPELPAGLYFLSLRNTATGAVSTFRYSKL